MATVTAVSSIAYAHYTLYEALPRIAARGFSRVEIGSFCSYCYHFNNNSPRPAELKTMLADHGLAPVALNWSGGAGLANDTASAAPWIEAFRRKIDDALAAGIPMMTMHFGPRHEPGDLAERRKIAVDAYTRLADQAQRQGMIMLLEMPHLHLVHDDAASVIELLNAVDHANVGLLLDSSHWGAIGYDLDAFLDAVGDRLMHVHLRDAVPESTPELDARYKRPALSPNPVYNLTLTPGIGVVDFTSLARALDARGYNRDVTAEFEYFDLPLDEIEQEYDAGLAHLRGTGWHISTI